MQDRQSALNGGSFGGMGKHGSLGSRATRDCQQVPTGICNLVGLGFGVGAFGIYLTFKH